MYRAGKVRSIKIFFAKDLGQRPKSFPKKKIDGVNKASSIKIFFWPKSN